MTEVEELRAKLTRALEALEIAEGIMSFSRGDAYERECTEKDYDSFLKIYHEFNPPTVTYSVPVMKVKEPTMECPHCGKKCVGKKGLRDHNQAKHLGSLKVSSICTMIRHGGSNG